MPLLLLQPLTSYKLSRNSRAAGRNLGSTQSLELRMTSLHLRYRLQASPPGSMGRKPFAGPSTTLGGRGAGRLVILEVPGSEALLLFPLARSLTQITVCLPFVPKDKSGDKMLAHEGLTSVPLLSQTGQRQRCLPPSVLPRSAPWSRETAGVFRSAQEYLAPGGV